MKTIPHQQALRAGEPLHQHHSRQAAYGRQLDQSGRCMYLAIACHPAGAYLSSKTHVNLDHDLVSSRQGGLCCLMLQGHATHKIPVQGKISPQMMPVATVEDALVV